MIFKVRQQCERAYKLTHALRVYTEKVLKKKFGKHFGKKTPKISSEKN
jgi:hypothetical protein